MKHFSVGFGRVTKGIPRPRASAKTGAVLNGPNGPTYTVPSVSYFFLTNFELVTVNLKNSELGTEPGSNLNPMR